VASIVWPKRGMHLSLTGTTSVNFIESFQNLVGGAGAHRNTLRQIHPSNRTGGINQKFSWPSNIGTSGSRSWVQEIVASNDLRLGIGKQPYV
jgi:hypothetical protein